MGFPLLSFEAVRVGGEWAPLLYWSPQIAFSTALVWLCGGVILRGGLRISFGWVTMLAGMVPA